MFVSAEGSGQCASQKVSERCPLRGTLRLHVRRMCVAHRVHSRQRRRTQGGLFYFHIHNVHSYVCSTAALGVGVEYMQPLLTRKSIYIYISIFWSFSCTGCIPVGVAGGCICLDYLIVNQAPCTHTKYCQEMSAGKTYLHQICAQQCRVRRTRLALHTDMFKDR